MKTWNSINELIWKAAECKGKKDYLMKVEARIHYSDGNVRFANVENLRWYMHRSDAIGRFMNTTYGQSQDKTNVKVWTNRDVLYSLLAEHIVGPKLFSKSHFYFKICLFIILLNKDYFLIKSINQTHSNSFKNTLWVWNSFFVLFEKMYWATPVLCNFFIRSNI